MATLGPHLAERDGYTKGIEMARIAFSILLMLSPGLLLAAPAALDERPAREDEWGYRPAADAVLQGSPPGFCWRPQTGTVSWELECGRGDGFET